MEKLSNYIGKELKDAIGSVQVVSGKAKDSGRSWYAVELQFINGYSKRYFLNNEETFAWTDAFETLATEKQVEAVF